MPTKGATYVAVIVVILVLEGLISIVIISYSDTVDGNISLTAGIAPVRLVSNTSGQLQLFYLDGDAVQQGDLSASIQNTADVKCILEFETILAFPFDTAEYGKLWLMKNEMGEIANFMFVPAELAIQVVSVPISAELMLYSVYFNYVKCLDSD